jgi:hypothetical protein
VIIFARTRYEYPSYQDFWRFVEISGFKTCFVDEIDVEQEHTYIFTPMNGEVRPHLQNQATRTRRAKIIWWNLERPHDETLPSSLETLEPLVDAIWVSDRYFATLNPRFTFVRLAGHQHYGMRTATRLVDVCHLSYLWGRRLEVIDRLRARGVTIAPEAWGVKQQNAVVASSHLMLSMHQYAAHPIIEPIRFAIAASYGIPIVSERFLDTEARDLVIMERSIETIAEPIMEWLKFPDRLAEAGDKLHRKLCLETDFGWEVRKAVG